MRPPAPALAGHVSEMPRDLDRLEREEYDVIVVGSGIYGAWVAFDAAMRGLKVALVDQGDFGGATSGNSQRIVHGGMRYLQHADFGRVRESVRERRNLFLAAPHLVRAMPFLVPTYGWGMRSRLAMGAALGLSDLLSWDRNRGLAPSRRLPRGRLVSRQRCLEMFSGFPAEGLTGGAVFHDGQVVDSERLCLSILRSAQAAGADLANYVQVRRLVREGRAVAGVEAEDRIGGRSLRVGGRLIIWCTGPWTARTLALPGNEEAATRHGDDFPVFKAVVLVTRPVVDRAAVALAGQVAYRDRSELIPKGYRNFFVTPWRDRSLVGTFYAPFEDHPDRLAVSPEEIDRFLRELRDVCPALGLRRKDVTYVFAGLLPREESTTSSEEIGYAKRYRIVDHEREDGTPGHITVSGVKWTTARNVAERAVDLALRKLGREAVPCRTATVPPHGGDLHDPGEFIASELPTKPGLLPEHSFSHLIERYGTAYGEVLSRCREEPDLMQPLVPGRPEIRAEVVHAARAEMAQTLPDVVFRRTALGIRGWPGRACLETAASLLAGDLGWDADEAAQQLRRVEAVYESMGVARG